jgi:hypothetical protein
MAFSREQYFDHYFKVERCSEKVAFYEQDFSA